MAIFQMVLTGDQLSAFVGEEFAGAKIVEIKDISPEFVSPQELALKYGISEDTVRAKLASINKGVGRKCKYVPKEADLILGQKANRPGRKRAN